MVHWSSESHCRTRTHGFTLVELLITLAILGILAALAAPSFTTMVERSRLSAASDELTSAIQLTRNSAIQFNGGVTLAKITGTDCPTNQNWSCGWQVFRDLDTDGVFNNTDVMIQEFRLSPGVDIMRSVSGANLQANRWGQLNGLNAVGFSLLPKGRPVTWPTSMTVCANSGGRVRTLQGSVTC
jgi:type IV fimbrial biogenesis protein FimT